MLKMFLRKFINRKIDGIETMNNTIITDFLVADVADEYLYGYEQEGDNWVCIPLASINSLWTKYTLQEMEKMEGK